MFKTFLTLAVILFGLACNRPKTELQSQQVEQALSDPSLVKPTTTNNRYQPEWVDNADRAGRLTAVGVAKPNSLNDINLQRDMATNRGMATLARKLQTQVDTLYEELKTVNEVGERKTSEQGMASTKQVLRSFVSQKLRGAKVPSFWTDKETGNLFALCQLNDDASMQCLREAAARQPELSEALKHLEEVKRNELTHQ